MFNKILVLPGWITRIELYGKYDNLSFQIGKLNNAGMDNACVMGLSLGALATLRDWNGNGKIILIGPPLPKRNILAWFFRWFKFFLAEGIFSERWELTKNPFKFAVELCRCIKLLRLDFSKKLDSIPRENLIMIRGKKDYFFCDSEAAQFVRSKGFQVIEVENCGHNWNEELEKAVMKIASENC